MSAHLALAMGIGIGIAGLAFSLSSSQGALANRLGVITGGGTNVSRVDWKLNLGKSLGQALKRKSNHRLQKALFELPEILDLLAVCLSSGQGVYQALTKVVPRSSGELAKELGKILRAVEFGAPLAIEMEKLSKAFSHPQFSEFANKISLTLTRGTPLSSMLLDLAKSARSEIRNQLIRQAGRNETRMLFPLVFLILPVTVMFAVYPSLRLLNFNFF